MHLTNIDFGARMQYYCEEVRTAEAQRILQASCAQHPSDYTLMKLKQIVPCIVARDAQRVCVVDFTVERLLSTVRRINPFARGNGIVAMKYLF